jgi:Tol biopolymer transport system component
MRNFVVALLALLLVPAWAWPQGFGKNKIQYQRKSWQYIQSQHFDIYFYEGGEDVARFTAAISESSLTALKKSFQFDLMARIPILVYNSHNDFEETNVTPDIQEESVGGFTEFFKGRVVLPYDGSNEQYRHVVHHELTHAVILQYFYGAGPGSVLRGITSFQIPGWMNEGLAEYESVHWDTEADNYIRDAVINNYLPPIEQLYGFFAYKGGQNFYYWVERRYGRAKVTELLQELRTTRNFAAAFTRALGEKPEIITEQWHRSVKEWSWPEFAKRKAPTDIATALTDHRKTENFINNSPALSPDGSLIAYLTDRSGLFDIYLVNAIDGRNLGRIVGGQKGSGIEELQWLRPGISWSPDNRLIAFSAKSGWEDVLHIADVRRRKIIRTYTFGLQGLWNPAWSPDSKSIAFSGMKNCQSDIYLVDVESRKLTQVTNDVFSDFEPCWSPDSKALVFVSDRGGRAEDPSAPIWKRNYANNDLYRIQPDGSALERITPWESDENSPEFYHSPDSLLFVSNRNGISNIYLRVLSTGDEVPLTDLMVGVQHLSISRGGQRLAFTSFYRGGYDVYLWRSPLANIGQPHTLELTNFMQNRTPQVTDSTHAPQLAKRSDSETEERNYRSFVFDQDFSSGSLDFGNGGGIRPVDGSDPFHPTNHIAEDGSYRVKSYRPKFSVDYVGAVSGYDPFFGIQGLGQLYLSDLTGNHQIGIGAYLNRSLSNSDFALSYGYMGLRPNFYVSGGQQVRFFLSDFFGSVERFRYLNLVGSVQYPLSRFVRMEGSAILLATLRDNLTYDFPVSKDRAVIFSVGMVRDYTRWGYFGPVDAKRSVVQASFSPGIGSNPHEFSSLTLDWRAYQPMGREWSLALRLSGGASFGKHPQQYILGGLENWIDAQFAQNLSLEDIGDLTYSQFVYPLRGTDYYEKIGTRYFLVNGEIRFPFIQFLVLQAPLPLFFQSIRGAAFFDVGSAWTESSGFRAFTRNDKNERVTDDVLASVGWGIRFYSPIGLLRIDAAWRTDLQYFAKPRYMFSLGTDF